MTEITGKEKHWWHDANGDHRMTDLRAMGYPERFWDADERGYIDHLRLHDELATTPVPVESDSPAIKSLFEMIETAEKTIRTGQQLIIALRKNGC